MKNFFAPTRAALLVAAGLSFVTPVLAQNAAFDAAATNAATAPLRQALAKKNVPLSVEVGALDASWRRIKPAQAPKVQFEKRPGQAETDAEYSTVTRGETLEVGTQTYLIAYRTRAFRQLLNRDFGRESVTEDDYLRLLPAQTLWLCLFDAQTGNSPGDGRAFDADTDIFAMGNAGERARYTDQLLVERAQLEREAANARVVSDMDKIGLALLQYANDYDKKLPPMRSSQSMADIRKYEASKQALPPRVTVQQAVLPYLQAPEAFAHPTTRQIYRPNLNLSGRVMSILRPSAQVVTFYEASPAPDGTRAVLYLDGHVTREREADWPRIRAASDAIAPPFVVRKRASNAGATGATVTLYDAAAMAYMLRRGRDDMGRPQQVYLSRSTGRVYYRDAQTKQAIWLSSPEGKTARGITIPANQAQGFREFQGYNGQKSGRTFDGNFSDAAIITPRVKTALGANAALSGSQINVDTMANGSRVILRGTTNSNAQRVLAEAIARKNAPGFTVENELVVQSSY